MIQFIEDLLSGLEYIHSNNYLHRKLKPQAIFVDDQCHLLLSNFQHAIQNNQIDNNVIGTPNYIAPELWTCKPPKYSIASDIFSLGCILYEIYTFRLAFPGNSVEDIRNLIVNSTYKPTFNRDPEIVDLDHIICCMLDPNPVTRISLSEVQSLVNSWKSSYYDPSVSSLMYVQPPINLHLRTQQKRRVVKIKSFFDDIPKNEEVKPLSPSLPLPVGSKEVKKENNNNDKQSYNKLTSDDTPIENDYLPVSIVYLLLLLL